MAIFYNIYTRRRLESIVRDRHEAMHGGIVVLGLSLIHISLLWRAGVRGHPVKVLSLSAEGYRNLASVSLCPDEGVNVICGDNAQGKTNLIEAIWNFTGAKMCIRDRFSPPSLRPPLRRLRS